MRSNLNYLEVVFVSVVQGVPRELSKTKRLLLSAQSVLYSKIGV